MTQSDTETRLKAGLLRPARSSSGAPWAYVILPKSASAKLPRRGRTTVEGTIDGHGFRATLEPDGQLSHWLRVDKALLETAGANMGDVVTFGIRSVDQEWL